MNRPAADDVDLPGGAEPLRSAARPWWMRALPFLGRAPALTGRQWRMLGVLGAANLIDGYDLAIMGLALPQIQSGLHVGEAEVGAMTAVVRLGVIPAVLLTALADQIGRRSLLLAAILAFTLCTFLTAFSRNATDFMSLQFIARIFLAGEQMLAVVIIAEELDAGTRGWGIGMVGALGTLGYGLASIVFSVVNLLPFGWRALYMFGVVPLLIIAWFQRSLSETQRFQMHRESRAPMRGIAAAWQPFRNVVHMYPRRMLALCAAIFPITFVLEASMIFVSKSLQEVHGYSPGNVAVLFLTVGVLAPIGNVIAGALADRVGRKHVMITAIFCNAVAIALFYNAAGWWIPPAWGLMVLTLTMVFILFAALGSELFPTSYRSTASGIRAMVATVAAAAGLWVEGHLYVFAGSHGAAITWMLLVTPISPVIIWRCLPETANQELEVISPERV